LILQIPSIFSDYRRRANPTGACHIMTFIEGDCMNNDHDEDMIRRANQLLARTLRHAHNLATSLKEIDKLKIHDILGFASKSQMMRLEKLDFLLDAIWRNSA
jgi:hypothetical protein